MPSIKYSELRRGMFIMEEGQLYQVLDRDLKTPGNLPSKLTIKVKNLKTGFVNVNRVHPEGKVEQAHLDTRDFQYLYKDGDEYVFMDKESFDQVSLNKDLVGEQILYLKENDDAKVTFYDDKALSLELPTTIEFKVIDTEPSVKGATAAAQYKPAVCETGLKIAVPSFIGNGDVISIDTRNGEYIGRAK